MKVQGSKYQIKKSLAELTKSIKFKNQMLTYVINKARFISHGKRIEKNYPFGLCSLNRVSTGSKLKSQDINLFIATSPERFPWWFVALKVACTLLFTPFFLFLLLIKLLLPGDFFHNRQKHIIVSCHAKYPLHANSMFT